MSAIASSWSQPPSVGEGAGRGADRAATTEEYLARALARAQRVARVKGYVRTTAPTWGLEESRPSLGDLRGASEETALDVEGRSDSAGEEAPSPLAGDAQGDLLALERAKIRARSKWAKAPGLAAMRLNYRPAGRIDQVLSAMIAKNHWDTPTKMGSIMAKWPQIVGPDVAEHSTVEAFEDHALIVRCSSTAWAKQLHLLLQTIERRIDEEVGPGVVQQVIIRGPVAPSWRKGPLSVKGRGPRDTYG